MSMNIEQIPYGLAQGLMLDKPSITIPWGNVRFRPEADLARLSAEHGLKRL
jgi:hypothetical protein